VKAIVANTDLIKQLNAKAVATERNRSLSDHAIELLDPYGTHLCTFNMIHNDREMRTGWMLKFAGVPAEKTPESMAFIDMTFEDFNDLPTVEYEGPNGN
jgi:hypothetical protein